MDSELEKTTTFFRFEDLRVYHKSLDYIDWVYRKVNKFSEDGSSTMSRRFFDSSQAIALHIAEGSARNKSQFIYYLKMAKSSVRECVVHTAMASKQGFLSHTEEEESRNQLMEMTKMLGALIGSLQRSAGITDTDDD
ncbi:MAG TPA: four helix bundle protein [Bacteroidales bacterium]|nr:four helix bundle protein [Bacteroidales bacterium]HPT02601.1 four helix bundle protein [Bacteroidales bacterium]